MYTPTLEQVKALAKRGSNLIPIYREVAADLETPVSAYLKIARGPYSFLLESVEGGERQAERHGGSCHGWATWSRSARLAMCRRTRSWIRCTTPSDHRRQ